MASTAYQTNQAYPSIYGVEMPLVAIKKKGEILYTYPYNLLDKIPNIYDT